LVLVGTLVWFGLLAPSAWANNVTLARDGTTLTISMSDANDSFQMSISGTDLFLDSSPAASPTDFPTQAGCTESGGKDTFCSNGPALTRIVVFSAGGNDRVEIPSGANVDALLDITFGTGDDQLSVANSNLEDVTASGGDGGDSFFTGPGDDVLDGGAGDDGFNTGTGRDDLLGGAGFDHVSYCCLRTEDLFLNLDDLRNDGASGEGDLIVDAELLSGSLGDDVITGDDGINDLRGNGGADRLDGRGGFDRLFGDEGNDTLLSRDGLAERPDCGDDEDVALSDTIDVPSECETFEAIPISSPTATATASTSRSTATTSTAPCGRARSTGPATA
jgi:Ca2+-binding RTX toxin-like protein